MGDMSRYLVQSSYHIYDNLANTQDFDTHFILLASV